jgi:hypothetical protein
MRISSNNRREDIESSVPLPDTRRDAALLGVTPERLLLTLDEEQASLVRRIFAHISSRIS